MRRLLERGLWQRSQVAVPGLLGPVACHLSAGSVSDQETDIEYPERLTSQFMVEVIESSLGEDTRASQSRWRVERRRGCIYPQLSVCCLAA